MNFLRELIVKCIPWIIPAVLVYSFFMNSDISVPTKKSDKKEKIETKKPQGTEESNDTAEEK